MLKAAQQLLCVPLNVGRLHGLHHVANSGSTACCPFIAAHLPLFHPAFCLHNATNTMQDLWGKVMWVWDRPHVQKLRLTISMANFRWVGGGGGLGGCLQEW